MQGDCIVTQLYHDVFRFEYCSVPGPYPRCCNKECLSTLCFNLSLMCFYRAIEILCELFNQVCRVLP
jgi:hypothetical protein